MPVVLDKADIAPWLSGDRHRTSKASRWGSSPHVASVEAAQQDRHGRWGGRV